MGERAPAEARASAAGGPSTAQTGWWSLAPRTCASTPALAGRAGARPRTKMWSQENSEMLGPTSSVVQR